jgi:hypothetical protein
VVANGHRLPALEVGVAGDDRGGILFRAVEQGRLESGNRGDEKIDLRPAIQPGVGRDLVVARAGGVELRSGGADALRQLGFHVHVDVLERGLEFEAAGFDVGEDFLQAGLDGGELVFGQQPRGLLGAGMGDRPGDVVRVKPPVVTDRLTELLDERGGILGKAAFPHGGGSSGQRLAACKGKGGSIPM